MKNRIQHDVAFATALHILEVFSALLREEEKRDAFDAIYERVRAGLENYEVQVSRMVQRLKPLSN